MRTKEELDAEFEEWKQCSHPDQSESRLTQPASRRLQIAICYGARTFMDADWSRHGERHPRLALLDETYDGDKQPTNLLAFYAPGEMYQGEPELASIAVLWDDGRLGTWRRYRAVVATARRMIRELGWELSDDERRLVDALEAFGRQAPAWALRGEQAA